MGSAACAPYSCKDFDCWNPTHTVTTKFLLKPENQAAYLVVCCSFLFKINAFLPVPCFITSFRADKKINPYKYE